MQNYSIAICDDDAMTRRELLGQCRDILTELNIPNEITLYTSASKLDSAINDRKFDLLILDIQMDGMTGMDLAHRLRKNNDRISIIFISSCDEYLREGYEVQPLHFLLKPIERQALKNVLLLDWRLNHAPKTMSLRIGGKNVSLVICDVYYIESLNHHIAIHRQAGTTEYYSSLSELEKQLPSGVFARCHNSYLVNLEQVRDIRRNELILKNGAVLPIGRSYYKNFQSAFITFINR